MDLHSPIATSHWASRQLSELSRVERRQAPEQVHIPPLVTEHMQLHGQEEREDGTRSEKDDSSR